MPQGLLPFKYEVETTACSPTAFAGLPTLLELASSICLRSMIDRTVNVRSCGQGWTDNQMILSLILLNLAGGSCVDDIKILEDDPGLNRIIKHCCFSDKSRDERRTHHTQCRRGKERAFPSPSSIFRYLLHFHDTGHDQFRLQGTSFVPPQTGPLKALSSVNGYLVRVLNDNQPSSTATLDIDATLIESHTKTALFCYEGYRAWQPVNVYWAEQDLILHSEFRDGQVPAGFDLKRVLSDSLQYLPDSVDKVLVRSDSAGYDWSLLKYMATGKPWQGKKIRFAVSADVTQSLKNAVAEVPDEKWHTIQKMVGDTLVDTNQQWAEICYVPNAIAFKKNGPAFRFLAIREPLAEQLTIPETEQKQLALPFPTMTMENADGIRRYKISAIVTNRDLPGEELIKWSRKRCGKSEQANGILKNDLAGGTLPSQWFGANAAWWMITILAFNMITLMKRLVLDKQWQNKHLKAIRFHLIMRAGRVVKRARTLSIRVTGTLCQKLLNIRKMILHLKPSLLPG